jgi:hypothetical protein
MSTKTHYETETLFDIFNDINITIINNNVSIKDKIIKKIDIIKNLSNSNIDVLNYNNDKKESLFNILKSLNYKLMSVKKNQTKLNTKLNTILGMIIHNSYVSAGFHVLLSNIPNSAKQIIDNKKNNIDVESIFDTIEHYIGKDTVLNVIQIDSDKYLVKFNDDNNHDNNDDNNNAEKLCHLIHNMMIEPNIIRAELLKNRDELDTLDSIDIKNNKRLTTSTINDTTTSDKINDNDICDYGIGKLNKNSLFSICIDLVYKTYTKIQEKIKKNIHYIGSFFGKQISD